LSGGSDYSARSHLYRNRFGQYLLNSSLASSRRFVLVLGLVTGVAALAIDMSLPSIPEMVLELATNMSVGQQVISLFMIGTGLGQLPAGFLSDRYGRLPILYVGFVTFTLASIATSVSNHIEIVLAARFFQGFGASVGVVITRAMVRDVASGKQMARLMSAMVMIFTATPMLAPIIGSYLTSLYGWRMTYVAMAVFGFLMLFCISTVLRETHEPTREHHIVRHLVLSLREFFSHRQSVFGVLLVMLPAFGFISMITTSAALIIDVFGVPVQYFGYIFAITGIGILAGSTLNRRLLHRYSTLQMTGVGATVVGAAGAQLLLIAWLGQASLWWIWGNASLFMVGTGFLLPNATALALDPVPKIAGTASSLVTALQNLAGSLGSFVAAIIYDGSITRIVIILGLSGAATAVVFFVFRKLILGDKPLHVSDED
jgi:DHA1 family bicyclomycin/chloramphenicol resistance-like MFS transporter